MSIKIGDLSPELRRKVLKKENDRTVGMKGIKTISMTAAEVGQHAIAVAAMLRDNRGLKPSDAQRVLKKAMLIV